MAKQEHKAARRVRDDRPIRVWAVFTDSPSFGGMVSAFDSARQARDERHDLREEGENWWIVRGKFVPEKK